MAIFKKKGYGKQNEKVIFLLAGWYMRLWSLWPAAKVLENNGYYCICYTYDDSVLSSNVPQTVKNMLVIKHDILDEINRLKKEGYREFSIAGGSLGTIIAILVANETKDVSKLILNTTGADTALNVWISNMTKGSIKKEIIKQGYTLKKLQEEWRSIIPLYNLDNLNGKKILVYLSKQDKAIPYQNGAKLVREFEKRGYDYKLIINTKFGHLTTALYNSFKSSVYLNFLKQN